MEPRNPITKEQIQCALRERHSAGVQEKLDHARVAVAGLGGLGSNVAFALARIGVGHLHLIDFDRVDLTNLNRQQYFLRHLGMYKTDALKEELLQINPYLDIRTDCIRVTENNLPELFAEDPIVCEAFDSPEAKAMLVNGILSISRRPSWSPPPEWLDTATATASRRAKSPIILPLRRWDSSDGARLRPDGSPRSALRSA